MRISAWSSDVCSSDLAEQVEFPGGVETDVVDGLGGFHAGNRRDRQRAVGALPPTVDAGACLDVGRASARQLVARPEARRVGTSCDSTCRSRSSPNHTKNIIPLTAREPQRMNIQ